MYQTNFCSSLLEDEINLSVQTSQFSDSQIFNCKDDDFTVLGEPLQKKAELLCGKAGLGISVFEVVIIGITLVLIITMVVMAWKISNLSDKVQEVRERISAANVYGDNASEFAARNPV
mmetsp:Transcript_4512/g.6795  ORF Transcript_4512/g.6795 Transcript_4512/m.6795 type:complete len:118 (+) Transcript_4512:1471-1824(+)|eukprot:CAMPEP_0170497660 /NCGR_PEP_ID=MMETSP0208-20121228/25375_1 /TAXON_ID=197538 /ORGANISM="Strombidium inclinatum, Strain S3" /LENGTH=117 /DNA_ID=CAMNT_0010774545 /DNA_START=1421 /DNA_END=1774 /DNA_ORIENTATION=+